jgi:Tol biopolymer transport system component
VLTRFAASRVPVTPYNLHFILSPDGKSLVAPLIDAGTTNLWLLSTDGGPMRKLTDFEGRPVTIVRRVSWSPDSKSIYAAVADNDSDVVLLDGLIH